LVAVTLYVPLFPGVTPASSGFSAVEVNPAGPVHCHDVAPVPPAVSWRSSAVQIVPAVAFGASVGAANT